jgi:sugar phosphate permease
VDAINYIGSAIERSAIRKIYWRLLPIAILTYLLTYIDRINVGFVALTMRGDLHMTAADFGFASGIFFWGLFHLRTLVNRKVLLLALHYLGIVTASLEC